MKKSLAFLVLASWVMACPFCDPAVLSKQTVYQGEGCLALIDYKPATKGHMLVIPKRHVERFEDLTESEIAAIHAMIVKVNESAKKIFHATGYLLLQKNGKDAGQSVPHVHFHYLPRKVGENNLWLAIRIFTTHWFPPLSDEEIAALKLRFDGARESGSGSGTATKKNHVLEVLLRPSYSLGSMEFKAFEPVPEPGSVPDL